MIIVGDVAKRKGLKGNEGLEELLSRFRNPNLEQREQSFITIEDVRKRNAALRKAFAMLPFVSGKWAEDSQSFLNDYVAIEFGKFYDSLSSDLFNLEREVVRKVEVRYTNSRGQVRENEEDVKLIIPLFAYAPACAHFDQSEWRYDIKEEKEENGIKKLVSFTVTSSAPPLSLDALKRMREAKARIYGIYINMLRDEKIGSALLRMRDPVSFYNFWIPKPSELDITGEVEEKDPILVAAIARDAYSMIDFDPDRFRFYLIASWAVKGEEPYQHYIAEFTTERSRAI